MRISWWQKVLRAWGLWTSPTRQPYVRKRLHLECLENRLAPASFTPTTFSDLAISSLGAVNSLGQITDQGNAITLRSAIIAANASADPTNTITLNAGTYTLSIVGNAAPGANPNDFDPTIGDLNIDATGLTINGAGPGSTIIEQTTFNDRVFDVNENFLNTFNFTIENLTIEGGRDTTTDGGGGAIYSGAQVSGLTDVENVQFLDNQTTGLGGSGGGAILNEGGDLTVNGCSFGDGTSANANSTTSIGGAIAYDSFGTTGTFTLTNSTFNDNLADGSSGSAGGAVAIEASDAGTTTANISGSTFSTNSSMADDGGAIFLESGDLNVTTSTFLNNAVQGTGQGGAIDAQGGNTATVDFSRFVGNTAVTAGNGDTLAFGTGGGSFTANDNWWGTNTGPAASDIATDAGSAPITAANWLQLDLTANPANIQTTQTSTLTASFLTDSAGNAIAPSDLTALIGLPITFTSGALGSLSGSDATIQATGTAASTFTAGAIAGPDTATALVDNAPAATANIVISTPPTVVTAAIDGSGDLVVTDTAGNDDNVTVVVSGTNYVITDSLQQFTTGFVPAGTTLSNHNHTLTVPMNLPGFTADLVFDLAGGNNTLTVDYSGGAFANAITYDGGTGTTDGLVVKGSGAQSVIYTPDGTTDGNGAITSAAGDITFTDLTPVDFTGLALATLHFPNAGDIVNVANGFDYLSGGTHPAFDVTGTSGGVGFENAAFWNDTSVVIDTSAPTGDDNVTIASADGSAGQANVANLTITTGLGADTVAINGPVILPGALDITTQTINITSGATSAGSINLTATGAITESGTGILSTTGTLTTSSGTGTALANTNTVSTFTATNSTSAAIDLTDSVGTLTVTGITETGTGITLDNTGGAINITGAITGGANPVNLTASTTIGQTAAGVITGGLLTTSSATGTSLSTATNAVTSLDASNTGAGVVNLTDSTPTLIVTAITDTTAGGPITVDNTGGAISITGALNAGANAVNLTATTTIGQAAAGIITGGLLTTSSATGTDLSTATNAVTSLDANNTGAGVVNLTDSTPTLIVTAITDTTAGGPITVDNSGGAIRITGALDAGANAVNLTALTTISQTAAGVVTGGLLTTSSATGTDLSTATNAVTSFGAGNTGPGVVKLSDSTATLIVTGITDPTAGGPITVDNTGGAISITGALNGGANAVNLTASTTISQTAAGVITGGLLTTSSATGTDLSTATNAVTSFNANNTAVGLVDLTDATPTLTLTGITDTTAGSGPVTISNSGAVSVTGAINAGAGTIAINANTAGVGSGGFSQNAAGAIQTTNAGASAVVVTVNTAGGGTGTAALGAIQAGAVGVITIDVNGGAISDNIGAGTNLTAGSAALTAATGIGSGTALNTALATLAFDNTASGAVQIVNTGGLTINVVGIVATSSNAGATTLTADSPVTFAVNTTSASITATATETATTSFDSVTVNAGVTVQATAGDVTFQAGDDIVINATSIVMASGNVLFASGFGDTDGEGGMTINGTISAGAASRVELNLNGQQGATENAATGAITAGQIRLLSTGASGTFTLNSPTNDVGTIAASTAGAISYTDANTLTVGTSNGTVGINSGGTNVTLNTGAALTIGSGAGEGITATGATVTLNPTIGGASEAVNSFVSAANLLLTGAGAFALTNNNVVSTIAAGILGSVDLTDVGALAVGSVGATNGITTGNGATTGGSVTITASGALTVSQPIDTTIGTGGTLTIGGSVAVNATLTGGAGSITLNGSTAASSDIVITAPITMASTITITALRDIIVRAGLTTTNGGNVSLTAGTGAVGIGAGGIWVDHTGAFTGQITSAGTIGLSGLDLFATPATSTDAVRLDSNGNNGLSAAGAITISAGAPANAGTLLNTNITTSAGNIQVNNPVTLNGNSSVGNTGGGNIAFAGTIDGGFALVLSPAGVVNAGTAVGAATPLSSFTVSAGTATLPAVTAGTISVTTSGAGGVTLNGDLTSTGTTTLTGDVTLGAATVNLHHGGNLAIGTPAGTATLFLNTHTLNDVPGAGATGTINDQLHDSGTLTGAGAASTTLTIGTTSRGVVHVLGGTTVTISGVTLTGGLAGAANGGGVLNDGTLNLTSSTLTLNAASNGGGIYNSATGTLNLDGDTIGGAAANLNSATTDGGGIDVAGGAVNFVNDPSAITFNTATTDGGGLEITGGTVTFNTFATPISNNTATNGNGGGINIAGGSADDAISGAAFANNSAGGAGGAIDVTSGYTHNLTISNSTIGGATAASMNSAGGAGGGIAFAGTGNLAIGTTPIENNSAVGDGGGLFVGGGTLTVTGTASANAIVSQNASTAGNGGGIAIEAGTGHAISFATLSANTAKVNGGGVYVAIPAANTLTLNSDTIGGASAAAGNIAATGGGLDAAGGTVYVSMSTFSFNSASTSGGGLEVTGAATTGNLTNDTIANNLGAGGDGIQLGSATATLNLLFDTVAFNAAGGLNNAAGATVRPQNSLFASNTSFDYSGTLASQGNNLFQIKPTAATATSDLVDVAPMLASVNGVAAPANYGGATQTIALLPGSAALGAAASVAVVVDQRGVARPASPDIGAYQSQGFTITEVSGPGQSPTVTSTLIQNEFTPSTSIAVTANAKVPAVNSVNTGTNVIAFAAAPNLSAGQAVFYQAGTTPIAGLTNGNIYFVSNPVGSTIQLSGTPGGAVIALTSAGTGTQTFYTEPVQGGRVVFAPTPVAGAIGSAADAVTAITSSSTLTLAQTPSVGNALVFNNNGAASLGLTNNVTYYVVSVVGSAVKLSLTSGGIPLTTLTPVGAVTAGQNFEHVNGNGIAGDVFDASQVDTTLTLSSTPNFVDGETVVYEFSGAGAGIGGLTANTFTAPYIVNIPDAGTPNIVELRPSGGGSPIAFSSNGTAPNEYLAPSAKAVSESSNAITLSAANFNNGDLVTFHTNGGAIPGLTNGTNYYVIVTNPGASPQIIELVKATDGAAGPAITGLGAVSGSPSFTLALPAVGSLASITISNFAKVTTSINFTSSTTFQKGEAVIYNAGASGSISAGLVSGKLYYVASANNSQALQLSPSASLTPLVTLTTPVAATQSLLPANLVTAITASNTLTLASAVNIGDPLVFNSNGGSSLGLPSSPVYYVTTGSSGTTVKLALVPGGPAINTLSGPVSAGQSFEPAALANPAFDFLPTATTPTPGAAVPSAAYALPANPITAIAASNTITLANAVSIGTALIFNNANAANLGLVPGKTYFVTTGSVGTSVKLALTVGGVPITTLTPIGAVSTGQSFTGGSNNSAITFAAPVNLGFSSGEQVVYDNGGGAGITGLLEGHTYFVKLDGTNTISLSTTPSGPAITGLAVPAGAPTLNSLEPVLSASGTASTATPVLANSVSNPAGIHYVFSASAGANPGATITWNLVNQSVTSLVYSATPQNTNSGLSDITFGSTLSPSMTVTLFDQNGNLVSTTTSSAAPSGVTLKAFYSANGYQFTAYTFDNPGAVLTTANATYANVGPGVASFTPRLQIWTSRYQSEYTLVASYTNPDSAGVPFGNAVTPPFLVLPNAIIINANNFGGFDQTVLNITIASSDRGPVRLINYTIGAAALATNQVQVVAFDFTVVGAVQTTKMAPFYDGPITLSAFQDNNGVVGTPIVLTYTGGKPYTGGNLGYMTAGTITLSNVTPATTGAFVLDAETDSGVIPVGSVSAKTINGKFAFSRSNLGRQRGR